MSDGKNSLIERLGCARHFACVNSFNPHNSCMRVNLILQMRELRHREAFRVLGACCKELMESGSKGDEGMPSFLAGLPETKYPVLSTQDEKMLTWKEAG